MPELVEQMYCSQQIVIPPKYPYILKRYCKAAIKTQPYDLLRWSYEYFKALAQHRPPPVKLRLEYPVYSTEGGLTRGCLKVLANQLLSMHDVPIPTLKSVWKGFCLDPDELKRIMCLCEVYMRADTVPFLHFVAVAGGLLTKSLTHTMILLCESLTKEPDGGSAAIPVSDFLVMYQFLAKMDASTDVRYLNGFREGEKEEVEEEIEEESTVKSATETHEDSISDVYWDDTDVQRVSLINDNVATTTRLSLKMNMPAIGNIERSPSVERAGQIERENYLRERKGRPKQSEDIEKKLRQMSAALSTLEVDKPAKEEVKEEKVEKAPDEIEIYVFNEDEIQIPYEFYGEPLYQEDTTPDEDAGGYMAPPDSGYDVPKVEPVPENTEAQRIAQMIAEHRAYREERIEDLERTFDEIASLVNRYKSANYDLGMVAGRQMSTTSGEFIVQHIEKEIMAYIDEQIAILPDPDLKKKKAKPEEVAMIRDILENFLDENMDVIVPELEEVEEEEQPIPEITIVYAVPGIGGPVDREIIRDFVEYIEEATQVQADLVMPRNIRHFMCPPLETYEEYKYEEENPAAKKKEEIPTGGVLME